MSPVGDHVGDRRAAACRGGAVSLEARADQGLLGLGGPKRDRRRAQAARSRRARSLPERRRPSPAPRRRPARSRRGGGRTRRRRVRSSARTERPRSPTSSSSGSRVVVRWVTKKSAAAIVALAARRADVDAGVEGGERDRQLGRRVRVGDRSADRPAVADLGVGDVGAAPPSAAASSRRHEHRVLERRLTRHRADPQRAVLPADAGERADPVEVDQVLGMGEPEVEQRNQALAARPGPWRRRRARREGRAPLRRCSGSW